MQQILERKSEKSIVDSKVEDFNWGTTLVTIMIFLIYIGATFYVLMESYT